MTNHVPTAAKPICGGIYHTVRQTRIVVQSLLMLGLTKDQITVVCSDPRKESAFRDFEHQEPAGTWTPRFAALFAMIGALLGGLTALSIVAATGDPHIFVNLGVFASVGVIIGSVIGGFIGAMITRGFDKELANFYDQGVEEGEILVAAEDHGQQADVHLQEANRIIAESGSKPVELTEG